MEAIELGIKPADYNDPDLKGLKYSLVKGFYAAYDQASNPPFVSDKPEGNALVLTGMLQGKRTLAIAFRGTDQIADFDNYSSFQSHYNLFKPLTTAVDAYIADAANGIGHCRCCARK